MTWLKRQLCNQRRKKLQDQMKTGRYRIFQGSEKDFIRNGAKVLEESISLFHGKANPVRYLSIDELNNMNVEHDRIFVSSCFYMCKGFWKGRVVLVKLQNNDDEETKMGFLREIAVVAHMTAHHNVHKILGCCLETASPVIVYEWVAAETLKDRIVVKDEYQNIPVLGWKDRLRIVWEISYAVSKLHLAFPRPIIHRCLAPQYVLLNQDNTAKLSNFSASISIPEGEEYVQGCSVKGAIGHIAPECQKEGKVAECSDVYSFGVLLLMLLTGKSPYFNTSKGDENDQITTLVIWASIGINDNCVKEFVDPMIMRNGVTTIEDFQLRKSVQLALSCVAEEGDSRPTMLQVSTKLKDMIRSHGS